MINSNQSYSNITQTNSPLSIKNSDKNTIESSNGISYNVYYRKPLVNEIDRNKLIATFALDDDLQAIDKLCISLCDSTNDQEQPKILNFINEKIKEFIEDKISDINMTQALNDTNDAIDILKEWFNSVEIQQESLWGKGSNGHQKYFLYILSLAQNHIANFKIVLLHNNTNHTIDDLLSLAVKDIYNTQKKLKGFEEVEYNNDGIMNSIVAPNAADGIINNQQTLNKEINNKIKAEFNQDEQLLSQTIAADAVNVSLQLVPAVVYAGTSYINNNFTSAVKQSIGLQKQYILFLLKLYTKHNKVNKANSGNQLFISKEYQHIIQKFLKIQRGNFWQRLRETQSIKQFNIDIEAFKATLPLSPQPILDNDTDTTPMPDSDTDIVPWSDKDQVKNNNFAKIIHLKQHIKSLFDINDYLSIHKAIKDSLQLSQSIDSIESITQVSQEDIIELFAVFKLKGMTYITMNPITNTKQKTKLKTLRADILSHLLARLEIDPDNQDLKNLINTLVAVKQLITHQINYQDYNYSHFLIEIEDQAIINVNIKNKLKFTTYIQNLLLAIYLSTKLEYSEKSALYLFIQDKIKLKTAGVYGAIRKKRNTVFSDAAISLLLSQGYNITPQNLAIESTVTNKLLTMPCSRGIAASIVSHKKLWQYNDTLTFISIQNIANSFVFYLQHNENHHDNKIFIKKANASNNNAIVINSLPQANNIVPQVNSIVLANASANDSSYTLQLLTKRINDVTNGYIKSKSKKTDLTDSSHFTAISDILDCDKYQNSDDIITLYHALTNTPYCDIRFDKSNLTRKRDHIIYFLSKPFRGSNKIVYLLDYLLKIFNTKEQTEIILKKFGNIILRYDKLIAGSNIVYIKKLTNDFEQINSSSEMVAKFKQNIPSGATNGLLHIHKFLALSFTDDKFKEARTFIYQTIMRTKVDSISKFNILNKHHFKDETRTTIALGVVMHIITRAILIVLLALASFSTIAPMTFFIFSATTYLISKFIRTITIRWNKKVGSYSNCLNRTNQSKSIYNTIKILEPNNTLLINPTGNTRYFYPLERLNTSFKNPKTTQNYDLQNDIRAEIMNEENFNNWEIEYSQTQINNLSKMVNDGVAELEIINAILTMQKELFDTAFDKYSVQKAFFQFVSIIKLTNLSNVLKLKVFNYIDCMMSNNLLDNKLLRTERYFIRQQNYFIPQMLATVISTAVWLTTTPAINFANWLSHLSDSISETMGAMILALGLKNADTGKTKSWQQCMYYLKYTMIDTMANMREDENKALQDSSLRLIEQKVGRIGLFSDNSKKLSEQKLLKRPSAQQNQSIPATSAA